MNKWYKYKGYKVKKNRKELIYRDIKFDSGIEIKFYKKLESDKKNGLIKDFVYHPKKIEYCNFYCRLTNRKIIHSYTPDFKITYNDYRVELIDTKGGFTSAEWKIRRDFILYKLKDLKKYDSFRELTTTKDGDWIDLEDFELEKRQFKKNKLNIVRNISNCLKIIIKQMSRKKDPIEPPIDKLIEIVNDKSMKYYNGKRYRKYKLMTSNIRKELYKWKKAKDQKKMLEKIIPIIKSHLLMK